MTNITLSVLALLPVLIWYLFTHIHRWRFKKYNHLPMQFPQSFIFGHLKVIAEGFMKSGDSRRHVGMHIDSSHVWSSVLRLIETHRLYIGRYDEEFRISSDVVLGSEACQLPNRICGFA
jgi:hypothetical protein